ncbi:MAG: hypothetical protein EPO51_22410 [Phenylobacterium sp.]|uniref:hypothetical protein n=1 Tax=Phenylobacterium sp. TaxID=1871053 RepID=UPI001220CA79|nr:hypothetical protein [Phenylobacterium sp.]TAJ69479.1 MAG: hypothetical protein EPO51_22410 [Phenylobacterium sp.]
MIGADPRSEMLFEMGQCAYRLGKVFGAEAERAETHERRMEFFHLFDRCFFAARMSVALELRLRREARAEGRAQAHERETGEHEAADPIERDAPETERFIETEADRERDREPVSLPMLLATLNGVAADASALPGPEPAALPSLRELLARVKAEPAPPGRPSPGGALRARLAGSATTPAFALASPPHPSGRRGALSLRRATGPPR